MAEQNKVIAALQAATRLHWTAIEAYTLAASTFRVTFNLPKLAEHFDGEVADEREHLGRLVNRLRYFEQSPDLQHEPGEMPEEPEPLLAAALALEEKAAEAERAGVLACRSMGDEGLAMILALNLQGSEESILWLESARRSIKAMGLDNWLASHMG